MSCVLKRKKVVEPTTYSVASILVQRPSTFLYHDPRHSADKMTLFILTETSAGYALLKSKDKKLLKRTDIHEEAATAEGAAGLYDLHALSRSILN